MIAANELRIGNLAYNQYGKIGTVWGFKVGDATHDFEHIVSFKELNVNSCYSRYIKPISLTPEILEKCGLKNGNSELDRNVFYSTNKHLAQFSVNISGSFGIYVGVFIALRSVHLEYLHQLQNLYFALTNEELNYTP